MSGHRPWEEIKAERAIKELAEFERWHSLVDEAPRDRVEIGVIKDTSLGWEPDHGLFMVSLDMRFGATGQAYQITGAKDRLFDIVDGILSCTGAGYWEKVKGSTLYAIRDETSFIRGIASSPAHLGRYKVFMTEDVFPKATS
jgi:hypothetical protein